MGSIFMYDAVKTLKELEKGLKTLKKSFPDQIGRGVMNSMDLIESKGTLSKKIKLLMCISVIAYLRCEECVALHVHRALKEGATKEEILEAATVAMSFGAGPSMGFTARHILPAIDQFKKEMKKNKKINSKF